MVKTKNENCCVGRLDAWADGRLQSVQLGAQFQVLVGKGEDVRNPASQMLLELDRLSIMGSTRSGGQFQLHLVPESVVDGLVIAEQFDGAWIMILFNGITKDNKEVASTTRMPPLKGE